VRKELVLLRGAGHTGHQTFAHSSRLTGMYDFIEADVQ
jgi:hypothetical protein